MYYPLHTPTPGLTPQKDILAALGLYRFLKIMTTIHYISTLFSIKLHKNQNINIISLPIKDKFLHL